MKKIVYILAVVILIFAVREWRYTVNITPYDANSVTESIEVYIAPGSSLNRIAAVLKAQNLIRSEGAFKRFVHKKNLESQLQAGSFNISPGYSVEKIVEILQNATAKEVRITIPEGFTVRDIDQLLVENNLITSGEFTSCASSCDFTNFTFLPNSIGLKRGGKIEGYLFPDTYFVDSTNFTVQGFAERLLTTFEQKVISEYSVEILQSNRTLHEVVTMASLVEKETRTNDERPMVAGILWKRLDEGMRLDVDATTRYLHNKDTAALTRDDLDDTSPYNTRAVMGLPPGPIANPGLSTIRATLSPESSPYYYYLHGTDGNIRYASSNDEHNSNKARYIR